MLTLLRVTVATIVIYYAACETSKCVYSKTCGQCIGESYECVWCSAANHTGPRCQINDKNNSWCHEDVYNPQLEEPIEYVKNKPIGVTPEGAVQLAPQNLKVSVRPGQTVNFTLKYRPAKDYPLDVYYLMDFSYTMRPVIGLLKNQGIRIYDELNRYTNNVRLGVGSFIEKGALPFASPFQVAYAFKHHVNLTTNKMNFVKFLQNVRTGSNFDDPEASLDALMQAMVCKDEIGWRQGARKIIVLCTDSTYHSAGDGKIAGAAKLNDMNCHLDNGKYSLELEQDYPSVNQIQKIAKQENTIVIFNVNKRVKREYEALAEKIKSGAQYVELKYNSDIVKIITDVYTKAVRNLQMDVYAPKNIDHDLVRVKLTPDCTIKDSEKCVVEHHKDLGITVSITVDSCLDKDNTVTIQPVGLGETLKISVETLCKCECEHHTKPDAVDCSGSGTLVCGVCNCNENHFGDVCDCIGTLRMDNLDKCKANKDDTVLCSGNGLCSCGKCSCHTDYSGNFCQYHDKACILHAGRLCAGNGRCHEGRCKCYAGWTGEDCHCPDDDNKCRAPHSDGVCSGNGDCVCGDCRCTRVDSKNNTYFGAFCDNCFECDGIRCKELEKYVECVYSYEKAKCDEEFHSKNTIVTMVNKTEIDSPEYHLAKLCHIVRDDGRSIIFKHTYEGKVLHLIIQKELEEPDRANMWIAIWSSIGAILLIGILTVIAWKVLVDIYDAREYKKFNKMLDESGDIGDINNVIYKPPTVTFSNPLFNRNSRAY